MPRSVNLCCCMTNRAACIVMSFIDIISVLVVLVYNSMRLADLNEFVAHNGTHVYDVFLKDTYYSNPNISSPFTISSYYKFVIGCAAFYLFISFILLYGAHVNSKIACKIWISATSILLLISMIFYCLLLLNPSSKWILSISCVFIYKIWEIFVVTFYASTDKSNDDTIEVYEIAIDETGTYLGYEYSQMYMAVTPEVVVSPQLDFDPARVNAYVYQPAFGQPRQPREAGSASFTYLSKQKDIEMDESSDELQFQSSKQTKLQPKPFNRR